MKFQQGWFSKTSISIYSSHTFFNVSSGLLKGTYHIELNYSLNNNYKFQICIPHTNLLQSIEFFLPAKVEHSAVFRRDEVFIVFDQIKVETKYLKNKIVSLKLGM